MTPHDIAHLRLASQQIAAPRFLEPGALLAHMGAMQAQDHANALWAIGLRVAGAGVADVHAAIAAKTVVRSWVLRGTLHFVAGPDLRWMLALLGARNSAGAAGRHRQLELDDKVFAASRTLFIKALQGGRVLSRGDLFELLDRNGIASGGQRGMHILWRLAQDGLLCFAGHLGKQPALALLDEWLPAAGPAPGRDEALARLAARYIGSHGPATLADFAWWAGLTQADAKRGLAACAGLEQLRAGDQTWWMTGAASDARAPAHGVHLLPGFDEYLLGYKDRGAVLAPRHAAHIVPGGNGVFKPMIVADGQIVGTWQRKPGAQGIPEAELFEPLGRAGTKALAAAVARYQAFCGTPP